jgi:lipid A 3-O-deacylase
MAVAFSSVGTRLAVLVAVASLAGLGHAAAQSRIIDEVKAGVMAHDITLGGKHLENGADINGEVLFVSPSFLDIIGAPRPHLGGWVNTQGNTDAAYFGLTWGLPIFKSIVGATDALTIYGSLGGAVHDGYEDSAPAGRKKLGSPVLFRESVELGYQITPVYSISAMVDHISNANLGSHNAGITNAGARVGIKF